MKKLHPEHRRAALQPKEAIKSSSNLMQFVECRQKKLPESSSISPVSNSFHVAPTLFAPSPCSCQDRALNYCHLHSFHVNPGMKSSCWRNVGIKIAGPKSVLKSVSTTPRVCESFFLAQVLDQADVLYQWQGPALSFFRIQQEIIQA